MTLPYDDYVITLPVRCGRRVAQLARKREPKEIGVAVLTALADMGVELAPGQTFSVRRITPDD